ncbi:hypothetical protein KP509_04G035900 [Ceratopteris richardii]|uniref:Uncharacterized protein n=1 Tax=Ceratopteris richardii TaxID=49495 RepID=A0A8T2UW08_CERRI|nr:hypothetical protein KP509_04G035900 [Ceratopteris richardii]
MLTGRRKFGIPILDDREALAMEKRNEQLEVLEDVHEMLTEALKLGANEPSVGLYFVQQHVQKAVPALINVNHQIKELTAGADLATADVKDSSSCIKGIKEFGPPIIEKMIKMLQTAGNQIPTNRHSRGSFSQLLPKPIHPSGFSNAPQRSSSFLGDWHSDTSKDKSWESLRTGSSLANLRNKRGPNKKSILTSSDSKREGSSEKDVTDLNQLDSSISSGCDSSDATDSHDSSSHLGAVPSRDSQSYVFSFLGSAIQKAGSVSREGVKSFMKDVEGQLVGDGRVTELRNWVSGPGLLRFSRRADSISEGPELQVRSVENNVFSEDLVKMKENYQQFQAERAAKLEAWLNQPDNNKEAPLAKQEAWLSQMSDYQSEHKAKLEAWLGNK